MMRKILKNKKEEKIKNFLLESKNKCNSIDCLKYKICVSGAAETGHCPKEAIEKAEGIGREIARRGIILLTGATTGMPYWAAKGAKEEGGIVIGFSPAASKIAHVKTYHLPLEYHDIIVYTGFSYGGRNLLLVRAADAVITLCGRIGTLNEFTIAFEDHKPIGVLAQSGGTSDMIPEILEKAHRGYENVVFRESPAELVDAVLKLIKKEEKQIK